MIPSHWVRGVYQPIDRPLGALYSLCFRSDFNTIKTVKTPRGGQLWRECGHCVKQRRGDAVEISALMLPTATERLWPCTSGAFPPLIRSSILSLGPREAARCWANASARCSVFPLSTLTTFPPFQLKSRSLNFQRMAWDKRQDCRPDRRAFHSPAYNKHSNTSVKSNNFTINEIPICLQCISRWHFPHCNSALIKFLKCKNASKRLKTSPGVSVPGRGLWYLIFIAMCPGRWKPEC